MSTENEQLIAEANRLLAKNQWTSGWGVESLAERLADALEAAEKRAEEADREPSDAEVEAAKAVLDSVEYADEPQSIRAALLAAQEVRRGD